MRDNSFPYAFWTKVLGALIAVASIVNFVAQYNKTGKFDLNELCLGLSWGLLFIFFSKEKVDDEMMQRLKFKALARATIVAFFIAHLYNYLFLNWNHELHRDSILSISAYQFMALTLIIAYVVFQYLKRQATAQHV